MNIRGAVRVSWISFLVVGMRSFHPFLDVLVGFCFWGWDGEKGHAWAGSASGWRLFLLVVRLVCTIMGRHRHGGVLYKNHPG